MRFRVTTKSVDGEPTKYRLQVKEYWWQPIWINAYRYRTVGHGTWVLQLSDINDQMRWVVAQRQNELARSRKKVIVKHQIAKHDPQTGLFE